MRPADGSFRRCVALHNVYMTAVYRQMNHPMSRHDAAPFLKHVQEGDELLEPPPVLPLLGPLEHDRQPIPIPHVRSCRVVWIQLARGDEIGVHLGLDECDRRISAQLAPRQEMQ